MGNNEINISFTTDELVALVQILDMACKSGGLPVAGGTLYFYRKFQDAQDKASAKEVLEEVK